MLNKLDLNLRENEMVVKEERIFATKELNIQKLATYKILKVMDYEGVLPKGYLTRVNNGQIKYNTIIKMVTSLKNETNYRVIVTEIADNKFVFSLIKKIQQK